MKERILILFLLLAVLALTTGGPVTAQGPEPWDRYPPVLKEPQAAHLGLPYRTPDGLWVAPPDAEPMPHTARFSPQATGGPDDYGYTWDDSVPLNWIDATTGVDMDLTGIDNYKGPFDIGFPFKFYENTYTQLYVSTNGLVSFGQGFYQYSNLAIPHPAPPNNFITPFWDDLCVNYGGYNTGKVYYARGGTAPNRYFVVEWYQISRLGSRDLLTFEVILHENGDIVMQYLSLSGELRSATVGIEDDLGTTGLQYLYNAPGLANNKAIRFYRPATPAANVKVYPLYQVSFTRAGEAIAFQVNIRNTGGLGADTYDVIVNSTWPVSLFRSDGTTPLSDTDGDSVIDTGPVAQGASATVVARMTTPQAATVGSANAAVLTIRSSLNPGKSKTATLQTAVPAPFAQVYRDDADGAMSLYLVQPNAQAVKKVTGDSYYGYEMAIAEMPSSFAYFWRKCRSVGNVYVCEIEYTLLDRYGNTTRGVSKLTDHSGATVYTYDYAPAVAVAPNGRIGVLWYRYLERQYGSTWQFNCNIWFAILDAAGNVVYGPLNLTNNNAWGTWSDYGLPRFYSPRIAATGDNRFVLAWERVSRESAGWLEDIYYAVRDANGGQVKGLTKFTSGVAGGNWYEDPALAALSGNRALLVYQCNVSGKSYAVLDSTGNVVKPETPTGGSGWESDAVQLPNGNIVIAWHSWTGSKYAIEFAILNGATYNVVAGPTVLDNPAAPTGDGYVSVAADRAGHAILTWMDYDWSYRRNLYYALVDGSGNVLTPPMIFRTSQATSPRIETSSEGYGNTSWSVDFTPPTNPTTLTSSSHVTGTWSNNNRVQVAWSGAEDDYSGVDGYSVRWDNAPTTIPDAVKDLEENIQSTTSNPLADGNWYFHIRTVDNAGNWAPGAAHIGPFRIDTTPPRSQTQSPEYATGPFRVAWSGSDAHSGIAWYNVEVRDGESGTWTRWLTHTTALSATYSSVITGHTYYFRTIARDVAGNVESDVPAGGDSHTTIAAYQVGGRVTNNRGQPVFNAAVSAQPAALNTARSGPAGEYTLYFESSGTYTLTVARDGFGALPPMYDVVVEENLSGVDFVLPPERDVVENGHWESGDLSGWHGTPGVTATLGTAAAHTGRYGLELQAGGGTLAFWPYVTQTVFIPADWTQPTLSFLYRVVEGDAGDALQVVIAGAEEEVTHTVGLATYGWTHTWRDLSGFAGQTVTLRFGFREQTEGQRVYVDEVSLGESRVGVRLIYLPLVLRSG